MSFFFVKPATFIPVYFRQRTATASSVFLTVCWVLFCCCRYFSKMFPWSKHEWGEVGGDLVHWGFQCVETFRCWYRNVIPAQFLCPELFKKKSPAFRHAAVVQGNMVPREGPAFLCVCEHAEINACCPYLPNQKLNWFLIILLEMITSQERKENYF